MVGFVDNSNLKIGKNIENLPVYSLEEAENILLQSKVYLVLNNKYEGEIKKQLMENSKNPFVCVKDIDFSYNNVSYYDEEYFIMFMNCIFKYFIKNYSIYILSFSFFKFLNPDNIGFTKKLKALPSVILCGIF